jgi:hypothetical protein
MKLKTPFRMRTWNQILVAAGLAMVIAGCSDVIHEGTVSNIQFRLSDMPGEFQEVNIDVVAVNIIVNDSLIELGTNKGVYNLLEFVNGRDTLLVDDQIPSGFVSQVRLILGENNTLMIDSTVYDMKTPSAQQSGLKFNVHQDLAVGESYAYVIDFRVEKSVLKTGNDKYILKPVIRVFSEAITGSIKGVVQPAEAKPLVKAIMEGDTVSTYADSLSGSFVIRGLSEGNYLIDLEPVEGYKDTVLSEIGVIHGQVTALDTIFIQSQ